MNKESIILDVLARKQEPQSLKDVLSATHFSIPERTLRRTLKVLADNGKITLTGQYKNRKYLLNIAEPSKAQSNATLLNQRPEIENIFSEASLSILQKLKRPLYLREACTYNEDWLKSYLPNETFYLSEQQRKLLFDRGSQTLNEQPAGTYANKIYERLLVDLSYNSSRLEGNTYTFLDTQKLLLEGKAADDKLDADRVMILNHKEAIRFLVKGIERVNLSEESIRTLHYLLSDGLVLSKDSGNVRQDSVKISGSVYIPLDNPTRIYNIFLTIIEKAQKIKDSFEQAFFVLVHLSYLQAFIDVNKRIARLAANIPLIKNNFSPLSFNHIEKEDYRSAVIAIYEINEVSPLLDLFIFSYLKTCKEYQVTYEAIAFDALRIRYRQPRRELIASIIKHKIRHIHFTDHINNFAKNNIPKVDQEKFILDVLDDLHHLDIFKLAGLGITRQEFEEWQLLQN